MTEPEDGPPAPELPSEGLRECGYDHGFAVWTTPEWLRWYFRGTDSGDAIDALSDERLAELTRQAMWSDLTESAYDRWLESVGSAIATLAQRQP